MKKLIIAAVAVLVALAAFLLLSTQGGAAKSDSLADGVLTIGLECDYAPYNWTSTKENKTEAGVPISGSDNAYCNGYDIVTAQQIADELGVKLEVKKIAWDGLIPALQANQIDAIIAGMSPTDERKQTISFTEAYYAENSYQGMVVSANSKYASAKTLADFAGAKISAQLGTLQEQLIDQINGVNKIDAMTDYATLQQATLAGQIDGYVAEQPIGEETVADNDALRYIPLNDKGGFVLDESMTTSAIGIRKNDSALQEAINKILAKISKEERTSRMQEASTQAGE